jgi:hypothetical protein
MMQANMDPPNTPRVAPGSRTWLTRQDYRPGINACLRGLGLARVLRSGPLSR